MSKEINKALTLAYKSVIKLGWNHSQISEAYYISFPTLKRIRNGRKGRPVTDNYCLKSFIDIIYKAFRNDIKENGGANSALFNRTFREVLLENFSIVN